MTTTRSRFQPQASHWHEDLVPRGSSEVDDPALFDAVRASSLSGIELSRSSSMLRGPALLMGVLVSAFLILAGWEGMFSDLAEDFSEDVFFSLTTIALAIFNGVAGIFLIRLDLALPSDQPIRFDRAKGRVVVYECRHTWNPFGRWPATIKEFDWDTVHAELTRQAGFSGKAYIVRYALFLVSCKPGTTEVVDRIQLKGNVVTTAGLRATWAYCRHFMEHGRTGLPEYPVKKSGANFWHSLFFYMPWFDPTEEGRAFRRDLPAIGWFVAAIATPLFWILLPFGLCHYLVMRVAPQPKWPPEIDARSRSAHAG